MVSTGRKRAIGWGVSVLAVLLMGTACQPQSTPTQAADPTAPLAVGPTPTHFQPRAATAVEIQTAVETPTSEPVEATPGSVEPSLSVVIQTATSDIIQATATATVRPFGRPSPTPAPQAAKMRITKPGPYSLVSSPLLLEALVSPGDDGMVHVDLIGEDGRLMVSQLLDFRNYDAKNFFITPKLDFSINSAAELARVVVYTVDQFGQMISLVSEDVLLLQMGGSDITAPRNEFEPYLVSKPREGSLLSGGVVVVDGAARVFNDQPLIIELIDEQGAIVGSSQILVSQPSDSLFYVPYQVTVPYSITHRTRVRLTIRQESATRISGTVWMSSTILFLDP